MSKGIFNVPKPINEKVKSYIKGSEERKELMQTYLEMNNSKVNIPLYIGNKEILTDNKKNINANIYISILLIIILIMILLIVNT